MITPFTHQFEPATDPAAPVLLVLHGTGGDENDLLPIARMLHPGAAILSPRGRVLERGMPRFFRRLAEGVFDHEDLRIRTTELAAFVKDASAHYGLDASRVVAVGYSNGANIAAACSSRIHGARRRGSAARDGTVRAGTGSRPVRETGPHRRGRQDR